MSEIAASRGSSTSYADISLILATPAMFAANMVAVRWAASLAMPPVFLAFGRWLLAFLILCPMVAPLAWAYRRVLLAHWKQLAVLAALGMGLSVAPQYVGARDTSAINVALIFAACPILVMLAESLLWGMRLGLMRVSGILAAVCGVLLVLTQGNPEALAHLRFGSGDLWVLLAAGGWAAYTVLCKRHPLPTLPASVRLFALVGGGALSLAPFTVMESMHGHAPDLGDARLYFLLAFLALVPSLAAYSFYDRLVKSIGPSSASVTIYLIPLFASLESWAMIGEAPKIFHVAGFGLILGGVILTGMGRRQAARQI